MTIKPDRALAIAVDARMRARLADSLRELLQELESLSPGRNNNPRAQSFMDKVKSFFGQ